MSLTKTLPPATSTAVVTAWSVSREYAVTAVIWRTGGGCCAVGCCAWSAVANASRVIMKTPNA